MRKRFLRFCWKGSASAQPPSGKAWRSPMDIFIITGLSGSGKSVAIHALEDNGFFCIDNLPALLIPKFIDLCHGYQEEIKRIALGVDLRGGQFLQTWPQVLTEMRAAGHHVQ